MTEQELDAVTGGRVFINMFHVEHNKETDEMPDDMKEGLPVAGYKPQNQAAIAIVNSFKQDEERILRKLDDLTRSLGTLLEGPKDIDQRWLAIGRTQLEQAFMAINRSVFRPGRVDLPEDKAPEAPKYVPGIA